MPKPPFKQQVAVLSVSRLTQLTANPMGLRCRNLVSMAKIGWPLMQIRLAAMTEATPPA